MEDVKILFIQGIKNSRLKEDFIKELSSVTGMEIVHFPLFFGLSDAAQHKELIERINDYIKKDPSRFIILAHSFGGVLAYCLSDETYKKVDKIITFASPHAVPFRWFRKVVEKLPYRKNVSVPIQESCGFFFDLTVPFFFTRHKHAKLHKNFLGTHIYIPHRKAFFKKLILEGL